MSKVKLEILSAHPPSHPLIPTVTDANWGMIIAFLYIIGYSQQTCAVSLPASCVVSFATLGSVTRPVTS